MLLHKLHNCLAASQIQKKTFNGSPHLVLPVVMLTVGVHAGSAGPLFYPAEELQNSAHLWNGKPVLVNHPLNGNLPVSANTPRVWEGQVLGQIWNARFDENRLKAEIWINEERTRTIAPGLLRLLAQGENIDVSTGLFSTDEVVTGIHNGERYKAIARRHVPDHLAILPDMKGACSFEKGCGIRVNESLEETVRIISNMYQDYLRLDGSLNYHDEGPLILSTMNKAKTIINKASTVEEPMILGVQNV